MLDIKFIRENLDLVRQAAIKKKADPALVAKAIATDLKYRQLLGHIEALRAERNKLGKDDIEQAKKIKEDLKEFEPQVKEVEQELNLIMRMIPNIPLDSVPEGKDDTENVEVRKWGTPRKFDFTPKDHLELGEKLGVINMQTASKVAGPRFGYWMGDMALIEMALVNHSFKKLSQKGFIAVIPPVMIKPEVYVRMARLDPGQEEERYHLPGDELYLIGSAEHTLGPLHMDETLEEKDLPKRYVGFSTCFRRESGSYGKDTKGMFRVHQFDKVEMESFTLPEDGEKEQDFLVSLQEEIMQELELPYHVVNVCTGDMGGPDARQFDIETWLPSQNKYRETHSADYMTDYQSRRLNTKVKRADGKTEFVYMNDATFLAMSRTLIAIMENYQNEDGSITIPKILQPYMGKDKIAVK